MPFTAYVLKVLIASPNDTRPYRDAIVQALYAWNGDRAEGAQVILLPRRYETDAVPLYSGEDGQSVINEQLVDDADIVFGVFHATLGRPTPRAASGTAEELERASVAGKRVHVYFGSMDIPRNDNRDQLAALDAFKREMSAKSLYGSFDAEVDLQSQVRTAIEHDLTQLALPPQVLGEQERQHAELHAHYASSREPKVDNKGRTKMVSRNERIIVENRGQVRAERVRLAMTPVGPDGEAPEVHEAELAPDILPGGQFPFHIFSHMGTATTVDLTMTWNEGEEERSESQTLSLLG